SCTRRRPRPSLPRPEERRVGTREPVSDADDQRTAATTSWAVAPAGATQRTTPLPSSTTVAGNLSTPSSRWLTPPSSLRNGERTPHDASARRAPSLVSPSPRTPTSTRRAPRASTSALLASSAAPGSSAAEREASLCAALEELGVALQVGVDLRYEFGE